MTVRPIQQTIFSSIKIPAGTRLAANGFYLLSLSNSGLAAAVRAADTTIYVRSTAGMKAGDTITIGTGSDAEIRTIASLGTPAAKHTTLWQRLPDGPVITIPAGSTNVPVTSTAGFVVGQKIALGYDTTYPAVVRNRERYEVATVTAVGKPGIQAFLTADDRPVMPADHGMLVRNHPLISNKPSPTIVFSIHPERPSVISASPLVS